MDPTDYYKSSFPNEDDFLPYSRMGSSLMSNQMVEHIDRSNSEPVRANSALCHGCGRLGHSRPNCPYKDVPGWIARGKRTFPLDIENISGSEEVCHGCGHFGHSRPSCPLKDALGFFPYGHRRVPLDLTNITRNHSYNFNSANGEFCHGCGHQNHNRPQCPYKDHPGWASRGQRRTPLDVTPAGYSNYSSTNPSITQTYDPRPLHETLSSASNATDGEINRDGSLSTINEMSSKYKSLLTHKYDNVSIFRLPGLLQTTISSDSHQAITVSISLDPTKIPNIISTSLFNQLCAISDVAVCRHIMNIPSGGYVSSFPSVNGLAFNQPKSIQLQYFVRLKLHLTDIQLSFEDEFYIADSSEVDDNTSSYAFSGLELGYFTIFQYGLFKSYADKFTISPNVSPSGSDACKPCFSSNTATSEGEPNRSDISKLSKQNESSERDCRGQGQESDRDIVIAPPSVGKLQSSRSPSESLNENQLSSSPSRSPLTSPLSISNISLPLNSGNNPVNMASNSSFVKDTSPTNYQNDFSMLSLSNRCYQQQPTFQNPSLNASLSVNKSGNVHFSNQDNTSMLPMRNSGYQSNTFIGNQGNREALSLGMETSQTWYQNNSMGSMSSFVTSQPYQPSLIRQPSENSSLKYNIS